MTTKVPPSYEEAIVEAKRLLSTASTQEESIEYAKGAIEVLQDDEQVRKFEEDVEKVSVSAIQIDQAFDRVSRGFKDMVDNHGSDFPGIARYKGEWDGYQAVYKLLLSQVYLLTSHL